MNIVGNKKLRIEDVCFKLLKLKHTQNTIVQHKLLVIEKCTPVHLSQEGDNIKNARHVLDFAFDIMWPHM